MPGPVGFIALGAMGGSMAQNLVVTQPVKVLERLAGVTVGKGAR